MTKRTGDPGQRAEWCIHYGCPRGSEPVCAAGVDLNSFHGVKFDMRPCFLDKKGQSKPSSIPCEHLRRPTPDEIAAHEKWSADRMNAYSKVLSAIASWRKENKGRGASQVIDCPACGAKQSLSMTIAAFNGHVHGRCTTEGCVSWME